MAEHDGDVRDRLRRAALAAFSEHGYDRTTAAKIAAEAGVTERTFFRHFSDKREVLFDGETRVKSALVTAVVEAPSELGALDALVYAFRAFQPMLEDSRSYSGPRQAVISANPPLQERELAKLAALADALADALKHRGVGEVRALFAARTGMVAFIQATQAWLDDPTLTFSEQIELAVRELKAVVT